MKIPNGVSLRDASSLLDKFTTNQVVSKKSPKNKKKIAAKKEKKEKRIIAKNTKRSLKCAENLTVRATKYELILKEMLERKLISFEFQKVLSVERKFYVVDFLVKCKNNKCIVVELDGSHHYTEKGEQYDAERTKWINDNFGYKVIRFRNDEVYSHLDYVVKTIMRQKLFRHK